MLDLKTLLMLGVLGAGLLYAVVSYIGKNAVLGAEFARIHDGLEQREKVHQANESILRSTLASEQKFKDVNEDLDDRLQTAEANLANAVNRLKDARSEIDELKEEDAEVCDLLDYLPSSPSSG